MKGKSMPKTPVQVARAEVLEDGLEAGTLTPAEQKELAELNEIV
jgi:hypothetical protein